MRSSLPQIVNNANHINWFPGHMYSGMKKMIGKLNTVDCVIEIHDARIPFTGRNEEFRRHLGQIKPHLLVMNKRDLADLSRWKDVEHRLAKKGDKNVILTDLTGTGFEHGGYNNLLSKAVEIINASNRFNRMTADHFKIMIVGIPNVGKSTLVNRLRQYHLGFGGEPAKTGSKAGVTRHVENRIKICARPPVYLLDTPGVLQPSKTRDKEDAMRLALCATVDDGVFDAIIVASYLLHHLNEIGNDFYVTALGINRSTQDICELYKMARRPIALELGTHSDLYKDASLDGFCRALIKLFRKGVLGKVLFD